MMDKDEMVGRLRTESSSKLRSNGEDNGGITLNPQMDVGENVRMIGDNYHAGMQRSGMVQIGQAIEQDGKIQANETAIRVYHLLTLDTPK